jgi:Holliday junction DNA helicase RuvA
MSVYLLLRGTIYSRLPAESHERCIFLVGDHGYAITLPRGSLDRIVADEAGRLLVHIWTIYPTVPDGGGPTFYGFATARERDLFCRIIQIDRVGPTVGLAILGATTIDEFRAVIAAGDPRVLEAIPHVGKKTAARLLLDLRDQIPAADQDEGSVGRRALLRTALAGLGFGERVVQDVVARMTDLDRPMEELLREGLRQLT